MLSQSSESSDSDYEMNEFSITRDKEKIQLQSPVIGDTLTLRAPQQEHWRLQTTRAGLKELKKVEQQIQHNVMPDFGYAHDNYLLEQHTCKNKWQLMTGFVGDSERFSQLMNYIKLAKIESEIREVEVAAERARR